MTEMHHIDHSTTEANTERKSGMVELVKFVHERGIGRAGPPIEEWGRPIVQLIVAVPDQKEPKLFHIGLRVDIDPRVSRAGRWIQETPSWVTVDTTLTPRPNEICCVEIEGRSGGHRLKLVMAEHLKLSRNTVLVGVVRGAGWTSDDYRKERGKCN